MNRKLLIIIGLAALIAGSTGVAFASNSGKPVQAGSAEPSAAVAADDGGEAQYDDVQNEPAADLPAAESQAIIAEEETTAMRERTDLPLVDGKVIQQPESTEELPQSQAVLNDTYAVLRVLDAESGEEVSPQVALGKYYSGCYMSTFTDGTLELCLNPSAEITRKGIYSIYNDILYVDYGNNEIEKYPIIYSHDAVVDSIIVSDGTYDYYFG